MRKDAAGASGQRRAAGRVGAFLIFLLCAGAARAAAGAERTALIVSGAAGGEEYAARYAAWSADLAATLVGRYGFDPARVTTLSERGAPEAQSTAANIRRVLAALRAGATREDLCLLVLIGHGTFDGADAKLNLPGPDLEAGEWAALLRPLPQRLVVVNTAAASFPFLDGLAAPRRIVITATDSAAQRFDTVFPEYFIRALGDTAADLDKNGRSSIWELFAAASAGVQRHYQQRGQLATERPLLDDTGDGIGTEVAAEAEALDGEAASRTYLDETRPGAAAADSALSRLLQRQAVLLSEAEDLRIRKAFLSQAEYALELERVMVALARVSRDIRRRTGS